MVVGMVGGHLDRTVATLLRQMLADLSNSPKRSKHSSNSNEESNMNPSNSTKATSADCNAQSIGNISSGPFFDSIDSKPSELTSFANFYHHTSSDSSSGMGTSSPTSFNSYNLLLAAATGHEHSEHRNKDDNTSSPVDLKPTL